MKLLRPTQFPRWQSLATDAERCRAVISFLEYFGRGSLSDMAGTLHVLQAQMPELNRIISGLLGRGLMRRNPKSQQVEYLLHYREPLQLTQEEWKEIDEHVKKLVIPF